MTIAYPYGIDGRGRTASTDPDGHVRDLIEQLLFTAPGERVMRPDFGSGLLQLVFEPLADEVAATTEYLVRGALEHYLGDVIGVSAVEVAALDATLSVTVSYVVTRSGIQQTVTVAAPGGAV